jgi:hypothetical protein
LKHSRNAEDSARTSQLLNLLLIVVAVDELKGKAIQEYDKLLRELRKGKRPKYDFLMNLICSFTMKI